MSKHKYFFHKPNNWPQCFINILFMNLSGIKNNLSFCYTIENKKTDMIGRTWNGSSQEKLGKDSLCQHTPNDCFSTNVHNVLKVYCHCGLIYAIFITYLPRYICIHTLQAYFQPFNNCSYFWRYISIYTLQAHFQISTTQQFFCNTKYECWTFWMPTSSLYKFCNYFCSANKYAT